MKIFIDIGHPAHVHYFRNFIKVMQEKGHSFLVLARDKDVTHSLLDHFRIPYETRGKGKRGLIGKFLYIFQCDLLIFKKAKKFKPDLFLSFGSPYAAHISKVFGTPHIAFDDTEHANLEHLLYVPFTDTILTPFWFNKDFGQKQIFFNGYMELCYLHPNYFSKDESVWNLLKLIKNQSYIVLRFVSWEASHDRGQTGFKNSTKYELIQALKKNYKIFISSEGKLPNNLEKYKLNIPPAELHNVLANATMYIGEGSTTASECSVLGIPNIYVNSLTVGNCKEQEEKYGICNHLKDDSNLISKALELLDNTDLSIDHGRKRKNMLNDKIDVTAFMVWFVQNYPESSKIMKEAPDYQYRFRSTDFADPPANARHERAG